MAIASPIIKTFLPTNAGLFGNTEPNTRTRSASASVSTIETFAFCAAARKTSCNK